jgi:hypothetical protein
LGSLAYLSTKIRTNAQQTSGVPFTRREVRREARHSCAGWRAAAMKRPKQKPSKKWSRCRKLAWAHANTLRALLESREREGIVAAALRDALGFIDLIQKNAKYRPPPLLDGADIKRLDELRSRLQTIGAIKAAEAKE